MRWLALWFSSVPMIAPQAMTAIAVDSSAYVVAVDTREAAMLTWNSLSWDGAFEGLSLSPGTSEYFKFFRMKEQSVTFQPNGTATLRLKASSPPRFPVIWNTHDPILSPSTSAHYFVASDSTSVMTQVSARHLATGEQVKVFWGDEWKLVPQLWVRPK